MQNRELEDEVLHQNPKSKTSLPRQRITRTRREGAQISFHFRSLLLLLPHLVSRQSVNMGCRGDRR